MIFCVFRAYCDARQVGARIERISADAGDTVGNRDACQITATFERRFADTCDSISDCYARQGSAIFERTIANACDSISDCYARQGSATFERIISNLCYRLAIVCRGDYYFCICAIADRNFVLSAAVYRCETQAYGGEMNRCGGEIAIV